MRCFIKLVKITNICKLFWVKNSWNDFVLYLWYDNSIPKIKKNDKMIKLILFFFLVTQKQIPVNTWNFHQMLFLHFPYTAQFSKYFDYFWVIYRHFKFVILLRYLPIVIMYSKNINKNCSLMSDTKCLNLLTYLYYHIGTQWHFKMLSF